MHPRYIRYQRHAENDRAYNLGHISRLRYELRQTAIELGLYDTHPLRDTLYG